MNRPSASSHRSRRSFPVWLVLAAGAALVNLPIREARPVRSAQAPA